MSIREELKHNFLKQIIYRVDYKGLLDSDVDKCVKKLQDLLYNSGLTTLDTRTENRMDFELKTNLQIPNETPLSVTNSSTNMVFVFKSENEKKMLEISKTFLTLTVITDSTYTSFDEYLELLVTTIEELRSSSVYFKALRIGLRKINLCFIENLEDIQHYFKPSAINILDTLSCIKSFDCKASNTVTILEKDAFRINYLRDLQEGITVSENQVPRNIYQVVIDIDVFSDDIKIISQMIHGKEKIEETLKHQNSLAFDCYINSLTDEFIDKLKQSTFDDSQIKEVI